MKLTGSQLSELVIVVASQEYGREAFRRRPLMLAVERRIKEIGKWSVRDDSLSQSRGAKSIGLANIDWAISRLGKDGRLSRLGHDRWRLP